MTERREGFPARFQAIAPGAIAKAVEAIAESSAPIPRPRFCATPGCTGTAEAPVGPDGLRRPSSLCAACVLKARAAREQEAVARATMRIPTRYQGFRFGATSIVGKVPPGALQEGKAALLTPGMLAIVLLGHSGAGKTVLAAAIANAVIDAATPGCADRLLARASRVRWVEGDDLTRARQEHRLGGGEPPLVREACAASCLILNELGRESGEDGQELVWRILNTRHNGNLLTVVTTFLRRDAFLERYDGGVTRRLTDESIARIIDLGATPPRQFPKGPRS